MIVFSITSSFRIVKPISITNSSDSQPYQLIYIVTCYLLFIIHRYYFTFWIDFPSICYRGWLLAVVVSGGVIVWHGVLSCGLGSVIPLMLLCHSCFVLRYVLRLPALLPSLLRCCTTQKGGGFEGDTILITLEGEVVQWWAGFLSFSLCLLSSFLWGEVVWGGSNFLSSCVCHSPFCCSSGELFFGQLSISLEKGESV